MKRVLGIILFFTGVVYASELPHWNLIWDFSFVKRDIKDSSIFEAQIKGFTDEVFHTEHGGTNLNSGFNFNYVELKIKQEITENVEGFFVFHITENGLYTDEAYLKYRENSFSATGGKIRSATGIINLQHQHRWFFSSAPLVYRVFFGDHGLIEKGVRVTLYRKYLSIGGELLQGENPGSFGYLAIKEYGVEEASTPSLYTLFIKYSSDHFLTGLSFLQGKRRAIFETTGEAGDSRIYGVFFRHSRGSYSLQGEYFYRKIDGWLLSDSIQPLEKKQSGYYLQGIMKLNDKMSIGIRYDCLNKNRINGQSVTGNLEKYTAGINFFPVEKVKIRGNYSIDRSVYINDRKRTVNQFTIELTVFLGGVHHHH
ncbi:hypothetical protein [Persephonella sp.]